MAEGNRKDPRARVLNMTVRYKSATVDEFIENHSHDISRGGMFIKTRSPFPAGTLLKFEVRIAEDQKLMHGVGRVVWRREPERAEENYPAGMGIKFIKTGDGAAELISHIVAARQGEESSYEAGARQSGVPVSSPPPHVSEAAATAPPPAVGPSIVQVGASDPAPALQLDSESQKRPIEAETVVSNLPKKRRDVAQERRKVVLQGSALEGPPSEPRAPVSVPSAEADARAPGRRHEGTRDPEFTEETTSPRVRASATTIAPRRANPSLYSLVAILGAVALVAVAVRRMQKDQAPPLDPPATAQAPSPPEPPEALAPAPDATEEPTATEAAALEAAPHEAPAPETATAAALEEAPEEPQAAAPRGAPPAAAPPPAPRGNASTAPAALPLAAPPPPRTRAPSPRPPAAPSAQAATGERVAAQPAAAPAKRPAASSPAPAQAAPAPPATGDAPKATPPAPSEPSAAAAKPAPSAPAPAPSNKASAKPEKPDPAPSSSAAPSAPPTASPPTAAPAPPAPADDNPY